MADSEKPRGPIAIDSVPWSDEIDAAMRKLDTRTRTQAVAKALALGLIAP